MIQNLGARTKTPLGILDINCYTDYGTVYSGWKYGNIIKVGEIKVGTDKDSDIIAMPGEFAYSLHLNESMSTCLAILNDFRSVEMICIVFINNDPIWLGFVDPENVNFNTEKKTLTIKAYDTVRKLLNSNPASNPLGYNLADYKKVIDIVSEAFSFVTWFYTNGIISKSTIEARYLSVYYGFTSFYTKLSYFYGAGCGYDNTASMLKHLLLSFNLLIFPFLDRSIYLLPRTAEYNSSGLYSISRNDIIENPQYDVISPINRLDAVLWNGQLPKNPSNRITKTQSYPRTVDRSEELFIDLPGGLIEESELPVYGPGVEIHNEDYRAIGVTEPNYRRRSADGGYSPLFYLWEYPFYETWPIIKEPRKRCTVKVKGSFNKWKPDKFYTIADSGDIWKATQFKFDLLKNTTEIKLRSI